MTSKNRRANKECCGLSRYQQRNKSAINTHVSNKHFSLFPRAYHSVSPSTPVPFQKTPSALIEPRSKMTFSFDQLTAYKDTIWGPLSAAKSILQSASDIATSFREKRDKKQDEAEKKAADEKDVRQDPDAMEMQDLPRQTTLDRQYTSASDKDRERARDIMSSEPKPKGLRDLHLAKLYHPPPKPSTPRDLPVRPPAKKRNWWMLATIFLMVALISSLTPLAVLLHHAHRDCEPEAPPTIQTTIITTTSQGATATETATETAFSWKTYTYVSVVISTYTFVPPPETTGIDAGDSSVVVPVSTQAPKVRRDVMKRFEDWQPPMTLT